MERLVKRGYLAIYLTMECDMRMEKTPKISVAGENWKRFHLGGSIVREGGKIFPK